MPERVWSRKAQVGVAFCVLQNTRRGLTPMAIYSLTNTAAKKIPPVKVGLEKDIQNIFERNLEEILDITFLASEYSTSFGGRIDTLGIDHNGSPVIIEYKRTQNDSVIPQGLSYLRWLLDHKADFEALTHKSKIETVIDWASPRVICVAESYNKFDLDVTYLLPIELYRYQLYSQGILLVELSVQPKIKTSTPQVFEKSEAYHAKHIFKEKLTYTIKEHLAVASENTKELFSMLKEKITALDESITEEAKAKYIAYKLTTNFCDVVILKDSLNIFINVPSGTLHDPAGIARDLAKPQPVGHWGNGDYEIKLEKKENIDGVMDLVRQGYEYNK